MIHLTVISFSVQLRHIYTYIHIHRVGACISTIWHLILIPTESSYRWCWDTSMIHLTITKRMRHLVRTNSMSHAPALYVICWCWCDSRTQWVMIHELNESCIHELNEPCTSTIRHLDLSWRVCGIESRHSVRASSINASRHSVRASSIMLNVESRHSVRESSINELNVECRGMRISKGWMSIVRLTH